MIAGVILLVVAALGAIGLRLGQNADPISRLGDEVFSRLRADERDRLTNELRDVVGDRFNGLSSAEARDKMAALTRAGFPRLDDSSLVRRLALQVTAIDAADEPTCAAFGRASFSGANADAETAIRLVGALSNADLTEWWHLSLEAAKAELAGTPGARSVSNADFQAAYQVVAAGWSADDQALIGRVSSNPRAASDHDTCVAVRAVYDGTRRAGGVDLAIIALYDIQASPAR